MESPTPYNISVLLNALIERKGDPTDLTDTLKHIAKTARMFLKANVCTIFAINPITHRLVASQSDPDTILENNAKNNQTQLEELIRRTFEEGSLLVRGLEEAPKYQFMRLENISTFVSLPLRIQHSQKPLGILCLYFKQQQFSLDSDDKKQQLFQIFSTQASFILQETWLLRRHQEVARIGQEINQAPSDITTLFEKLQKHAAGILDTSDSLMLTVYEPQTNTLDLYLKEEGYPTYRKRWPLEGACEYVIKTQKPILIRHLSEERKDLPFQPAYVTGTELEESLIYVPLVLHNVSLGVISIQHPTPRAYDQGDTFILQMLANHIALALYNIRLYSSLRLLNDTGQLLTQQPDPDQTLQATADKIRDSTKADIVVLYPYLYMQQRFVPPPYVAGKIQDPSTEQQMVPRRPDDIATLLLSREEPVFARESSTLYTTLMGDIHIRQGNFQQREGIRSTAAARLKVGDELVGALFINFRQLQPFDVPQTLLIEGLSHFAAIAINNARMLDKVMQRRLHELEILQKIDREMNRNLELQSVLDILIELTSEVILAEAAAILLYDPQTQLLETKSAIGSGAETRRKLQLHYASASGITRWVLEHKKPARVDNVRRDEPWCQIYISAGVDTTSELDVPLLDGEEMIGVLNFESSQEGAFSQEDENFLSTLAGQVVLALKKAQAYEREKRLAIERHALNEISKEIISQLDQQSIFELILEKALELTRSNLGNLMLYDAFRKDLWVAAERNVAEDKKKQRQRLDQGIIGYVATTKRLLNVDVTRLPWKDIYLEYFPGAQSELAVPMLQGNEVRGVLNVESPVPNNFNKIDEELLTGLADLAVIVLRNAEQYETATLDARRFALLYKAGKELSNISEFEQLDQAYDSILRIAGEHCQGQLVIRQYNTVKQALELIRASHSEYAPPFPSMDLHEGIDGQVARERRTIRIADTQNLSPGVGPVKLSDPEVRSLLITPIQFNERFYGTLGISFREIGHFSKRDEQFFEGLAQQLASTIYRLEATQERRELERRNLALELMGSIGQSAFGLTHRLSRVLGVVPLMVDNIRGELEQQDHINKFVSERLDKIVSAAKTVLTLSNKLKSDIARTRDAEQADTPVTIDPASILKEAESAVPLPSESSIQIRVEISQDVTPIHVIISSVIDILHNLIENAINSMPNGGIITLRARNDGSYIALEVIDTGVGIPLDVQPYIFELFYSTKGSSGFGLWSARRNAYKNGGDLKVESQPGHGTKFTLLLPRAERNIGETQ